MITDQLKHIGKYKGISDHIDTAIKFIENTDLSTLDYGKHVIDDNVFLIKSEYWTKDENDSLYEAHLKYIDLQVVLEGEEVVFGNDVENLTEKTPYDADKEAAFYQGTHSWKIIFRKNEFALFQLDDAHMPGVTLNEKSNIVKVVFKIHD